MKTKSTKCNNCGGSLRFSPKTGNLCCKKCGSEVQIDMSNDYTKHSIDMTKTFVEPEVKESIVSKHCDNCGATFKGESNKISSTCSYCGANLVLDFSNKTGINPDACIPFAFDRKEAGDRFKKGLKKKAFYVIKTKECRKKFGLSSSLRITDPYLLLGKGNGNPLSILAWKIPLMEETGRLQSMGS